MLHAETSVLDHLPDFAVLKPGATPTFMVERSKTFFALRQLQDDASAFTQRGVSRAQRGDRILPDFQARSMQ